MAEQTNFGKNALITGILLGVASGAFGIYTLTGGKVPAAQTELSNDGVAAAKELSELAATTNAIRQRDYTIADVAPEGAVIAGKARYTPIFFSPELWQVTNDAEGANSVVDIYEPTTRPVHADVPNHWFITNGIADALGRADGLTMDSDADGFSNGEEKAADTNPSDPASYPALIRVGEAPKLEVVSVTNASAVISVDSTLAYESAPTSMGVKIFASATETRTPVARFTGLKVGDSFGLSNSDKTRFTVLRFEQMEFDGSPETVVVVRDNVTASAEKEFYIRSGSPTRPGTRDHGTANAKGRSIQDTTVTLRVTAGPAAGKPEGTISTQVNGSFTVPGTDITCVLETVDAAGSVNVRPNGAESPVSVPKAAN